jgi:hypothetical protein
LKRRYQAAPLAETAQAIPATPRVSDQSLPDSTEGASREIRIERERLPAEDDPLANIREREERRSGFQYNSEPDIKKLI